MIPMTENFVTFGIWSLWTTKKGMTMPMTISMRHKAAAVVFIMAFLGTISRQEPLAPGNNWLQKYTNGWQMVK